MTWLGSRELVMGFHPTARGFGWTVFEDPTRPLDWGIAYVRGDKNAACLKQMRILLERYRPETLVLERFDRRTGKRASRVGCLCRDVAALATELGVETYSLDRCDVTKALSLAPRASRQAIAEVVARHVLALRHRLPSPRKPWESLDRRMALFSAAALVLAHFRRGASTLFDDLKDGPSA